MRSSGSLAERLEERSCQALVDAEAGASQVFELWTNVRQDPSTLAHPEHAEGSREA